jgi:hypothetical protein
MTPPTSLPDVPRSTQSGVAKLSATARLLDRVASRRLGLFPGEPDETATVTVGLIDLENVLPIPAEMPWCDMKVAFDVDAAADVIFDYFQTPTTGAPRNLPEGWELNETDSAGARMVAVFRITGLPSIEDGKQVVAALAAVEAIITADEQFEFIRPDEVAECWDGIIAVDGLYQALWACVPDYNKPTPEESEEPVHGLNAVTDFWDRFSDDHKRALNKLAEEN